MFRNIETQQYKFKMENVTITVDLDNSFYKNINLSNKPDIISYIKNQHYHMAHELFFVEESPIMVLADNTTEEYKNCILSIPPKYRHLSLRQKDYRILFSFTCNKEQNTGFAQFLKGLDDSEFPQKLKTNSLILSYIQELSQLIISKSSMREEIIISLLKLIFHKMYIMNAHKQIKTISSTNESYILKIDNILNSFQNDINLKTVAESLHLSTKQTARIISKTYHKTLSELLAEKRLNVACQLLCHTNKKISEIVEYINFPSESYFYQQFKKMYGCTPYKYKKMNEVSTSHTC